MKTGTEESIKPFIPKIILLGGLILLLTYGKILWPLMFGYMRDTNAGFFEALSQFHLHSIAFFGLIAAVLIGYLWAKVRCAGNGC